MRQQKEQNKTKHWGRRLLICLWLQAKKCEILIKLAQNVTSQVCTNFGKTLFYFSMHCWCTNVELLIHYYKCSCKKKKNVRVYRVDLPLDIWTSFQSFGYSVNLYNVGEDWRFLLKAIVLIDNAYMHMAIHSWAIPYNVSLMTYI